MKPILKYYSIARSSLRNRVLSRVVQSNPRPALLTLDEENGFSGLMGSYLLSNGKYLPIFRRIVVPSSRSGTVLGLLDPTDEDSTIFLKRG